MANRADIPVMVTTSLDARSIVGGAWDAFRADGSTNRFPQDQMHVVPSRAWVKTLEVETMLTAPQITNLQFNLDAAEAETVTLKGRATTLEGDTATQGQQIGTLTTRVDALGANPR